MQHCCNVFQITIFAAKSIVYMIYNDLNNAGFKHESVITPNLTI